jgi:hypothetical protein
MILVLIPKPKPQGMVPQELPRISIPPPVRSPRYAPGIGPRFAPMTKGLEIPLFGCAAENFDRLSPEDQARCPVIRLVPPDRTIVELRSHVRDPARHAEELASRKAPASVNCTHLKSEVVQNIVQQSSVIVDPLCAAGVVWRAVRR